MHAHSSLLYLRFTSRHFTSLHYSSPPYPPFLLSISLPSLLYSSCSILCSPRIRNGSRLTPNILFGGPAPVSDAVTSVPKARNAFERHKAAMKCVLHNLIMFFFQLFLNDTNCLQLFIIVLIASHFWLL
jgi:hypothetical protein